MGLTGISPGWGHSEVLEEIIVTGSRISREPADGFTQTWRFKSSTDHKLKITPHFPLKAALTSQPNL